MQLTVLAAGCTVTPVLALAKAFSHKPDNVRIEIRERGPQRTTIIRHDGAFAGKLYRVLVENPEADLRQHPGSTGALGDEMLTTRDLPLEFLQEVPLRDTYQVTE
jgi:hypothetical protein